MGKSRKRTGKLKQAAFAASQTEQKKFEHGPYYRGYGGYSIISEELSRREYTPGLCFGELLTLQLMNCIAWDRRSLVIHEIAAPYLALQLYPVPDPTKLPRDKKGRRIVPGERSVKRWLASLRAQEYIRLHRRDQERGHSYFTEPVFIWDSKWHELSGIETALCIRTSGDFPNVWIERWLKSMSGHPGPTLGGRATLARPSGHSGPTERDASSLMSGHCGPDPRSRSSDLDGAPHHAPNSPAGGVHGKCSEGNSDKGVGLPADSIGSAEVFNVAELPADEVRNYCDGVREQFQSIGSLADGIGERPAKKKRTGMSREEQLVFAKSQIEDIR
jgi:hypothetical protein